MGLFDGNRAELEARIVELEKQVAIKDELLIQKSDEISHLRKQVDRLQDAVLAVQHPVAFKQLKDDEYMSTASPGPSEAEQESARQKKKILDQYMEAIEKPLFQDVDDMIDSLRMVGAKTDFKPLHPNDES